MNCKQCIKINKKAGFFLVLINKKINIIVREIAVCFNSCAPVCPIKLLSPLTFRFVQEFFFAIVCKKNWPYSLQIELQLLLAVEIYQISV